jgi:protein SCO1/2
LGPDLIGVTERRERSWLARWIAEPDKMLEEGDPIATELFIRFREIAMPNLRLEKSDVDALIEHMASESRRLRQPPGQASTGGPSPRGRLGPET